MDYELEAEMKMEKIIEGLDSKFATVRAGRANPGMVQGIEVEYYGVKTPITSLVFPKQDNYLLNHLIVGL